MNSDNQVNVEKEKFDWIETRCSGFLNKFFPLFCPYSFFFTIFESGVCHCQCLQLYILYILHFFELLVQLLSTIDRYKILKAAAISPVLEELKLDEAHNRGVGKPDLLNWGWILLPAVLKAVDEQLLPGAAGRGASQNPELLRGPVMKPSILGVSEGHTPDCWAPTQAHDKTLVLNIVGLCQPVVGLNTTVACTPAVDVKR